MSWRKDQRDQRRAERGYHHGNLKEALLQAALGLIAEKGAAGLTPAILAASAKVKPAAPFSAISPSAACSSASFRLPW